MTDFLNKTIAWIKGNVIISIIIGIVVFFMFSGTKAKNLFKKKPRRRRRTYSRPVATRRRRTMPRSVGTRSRSKRVVHNKNGTAKKPWQIKGSEAARRHMRKIRSMR